MPELKNVFAEGESGSGGAKVFVYEEDERRFCLVIARSAKEAARQYNIHAEEDTDTWGPDEEFVPVPETQFKERAPASSGTIIYFGKHGEIEKIVKGNGQTPNFYKDELGK